MSAGLYVLLSVVMVCFTYVFCFTLNSWNWKKIIIRGLLTFICVGLLGSGAVYYYLNTPFFPSREEGYTGINLGYSENDVRFFYGEPKDIEEETPETNRILYMTAKHDEYTPHTGDINVVLKKGKVSEIQVFCAYLNDGSVGPYTLQGVRCADNYQSVIKKFGTPSFVSIQKDQTGRIISYKKYRVFFGFQNNKVIAFGVYDPTTTKDGYRRFRKEYVEAEQKTS